MVDYKKSGKTEQCLTLALLMKEDLFTFDDEEIEAGRLLFAGPCDFVAAALPYPRSQDSVSILLVQKIPSAGQV